MRKQFIVYSIFILLSCCSLFGQFTTVSGTITGTDGYLWAFGTVTATFTPPTNDINCNLYKLTTGQSMGTATTPCTVSANLDGTGTFVMVLVDDHKVNPSGSNWSFSICPPISSPCQTVVADVFGSSIDLSSILSNGLNSISSVGYNLPEYFSDAEVITAPGVNTLYFNVSNNTIRLWNGSAWSTVNQGTNLPSGFYNTPTGTFNFPQLANGNTTIFGRRATDTNCSGPWMDFRNASNSTDLFVVDCNGVVQAPELFISGPNPQLAIPILNNAVTGTTTSLLAKTVNGQWQTIGTGDTAIPAFPILPSNTVNGNVVCAPGTSGSGCAVIAGITTCAFDAGGGTIDDFVGASTTSAGKCKDLGATLPGGPICILGRLLTSPAANSNGTVDVMQFCYPNSGSGTGISGAVATQRLAATGANTATSIPGVCIANLKNTGNICGDINACYLDATTTSTRAGIIDATGYTVGSTQLCTQDPFTGGNKSGLLLLGNYTIATTKSWVTPQHKMTIKGVGGASPIGNNGNQMTNENSIIQPCTGTNTPVTGCTSFLVANNQLFIEPTYTIAAVNGCVGNGVTATCTTTANHNYSTNSRVTISGNSQAGFNSTWIVTGTTATTFTFNTVLNVTGNNGTVTAPQRQHGPYSASGSGLTGAGNYYALIALGGGLRNAGYDSNGTCGTGPVGADWTLSGFGSVIQDVAIDTQGLAGLIGVYSGNEQERGALTNISFSDYGGIAAGFEGTGLMMDRNSWNLNDRCANASGNGGPSHFLVYNIFCDASGTVAAANQGRCAVLAGNHTESDGGSVGGLAQYGFHVGTIRGLNNGGTQKSNYGIWIENYDDGVVEDIHFENLNADPVFIDGVNGWTTQGWKFENLDFASSSGTNNAVVHFGTGTNNNRAIMLRGAAGANPAAVRDEVFGCSPGYNPSPPCIVNGNSGGNPMIEYAQGGFQIPNCIQFGNFASSSASVICSGTGAPTGGAEQCGASNTLYPIGSIWIRNDATNGATTMWACKRDAGAGGTWTALN